MKISFATFCSGFRISKNFIYFNIVLSFVTSHFNPETKNFERKQLLFERFLHKIFQTLWWIQDWGFELVVLIKSVS